MDGSISQTWKPRYGKDSGTYTLKGIMPIVEKLKSIDVDTLFDPDDYLRGLSVTLGKDELDGGLLRFSMTKNGRTVLDNEPVESLKITLQRSMLGLFWSVDEVYVRMGSFQTQENVAARYLLEKALREASIPNATELDTEADWRLAYIEDWRPALYTSQDVEWSE